MRHFAKRVGVLMHLMTATRPYIAFAVGYVSRFMKNAQVTHWAVVKRIFRYMKDTQTHDGVCFKPGNMVDLCGFSAADWAGDHAERKSTSRNVFTLRSASVSW